MMLLQCLPHTRGGVSIPSDGARFEPLSSPHPWGCFSSKKEAPALDRVFPTPVGVFPGGRQLILDGISLPHTLGGVSSWYTDQQIEEGSSPHPWGCFRRRPLPSGAVRVFPTPVGVFPWPTCAFRLVLGLPHTRGGVSLFTWQHLARKRSSPHPWGCFSAACRFEVVLFVFPTPVGVFPRTPSSRRPKSCLPHARGGVSAADAGALDVSGSSPRPWGAAQKYIWGGCISL